MQRAMLPPLCLGAAGPPGPLERNVVVRGASAGGCRLEVGRVGRDIALRREALAVLLARVPAATEELHRVGDDLDGLTLTGAVLGLPLAPLESTVDSHGTTLREVLGAVLALGAPDGDVEEVGLVDPLTRGVLATRVAGHTQPADRGAAGRAPELAVAREIAREDDPVDVRGDHGKADGDGLPCSVLS